MKTNEFVLPEDWHVVATEENIDILKNWRFGEKNEYLTIGCFVGMVNGKKEWDDPKSDYFKNAYFPNEITFDQFKEHVLKEPNDVYSNSEFNSESKIIGYKLIKEEYKEAVKVITGFKEFSFDGFEKEGIERMDWSIETLKKSGVLELWFEPVFEQKKIKLTSGIELTEKDIEEVKEILKNK